MSNLQSFLEGMEKHHSPFENFIRKMPVPVIKGFTQSGTISPVGFVQSASVVATKDATAVAQKFPLTVAKSGNKMLAADGTITVSGKRIAVLFSGGPASGGHNVVVGIKKALGASNTLLGTITGPKGLLEGNFFEITDKMVEEITNTGGFDFLGSDRTKIKTDEQFAMVKEVVTKHRLNAIIIVGGDDSNTNAAILAELLAPQGVSVVGVPKTIDGDLQLGDLLPISFGFDTATKTYAEMVGNILQDTASSLKYWHFVRIMGRAASHVALETALQTRPAYTIISEEVLAQKLSLKQVIEDIAQTVCARAEKGIKHGLVLIPEGVIEFIPEMRLMLAEMDELIGHNMEKYQSMDKASKIEFVTKSLKADHLALFQSIPTMVQEMLLLDRDSHGNLPLSQIPSEVLIIEMTAARVAELCKTNSKLSGFKLNSLNHFFGYEGRCGAPTLFDAAYCLNLGLVAGSLALGGHTGYMASLTDLQHGGKIQAVPLTGLLNIERRHGQDEFVIEKALVKLDSPAFKFFAARRKVWATEDYFTSPGPRQLSGPTSKQLPISVALNRDFKDTSFDLGPDTIL
ncbi:MAG: diphosphate--fructose-6-phosphate 1-phosphotransferase [Brevinema sp.]